MQFLRKILKLTTMPYYMESSIIEANYPLSFRSQDSQELGQNLKNRESIVLIGMKRVGISNFLRFFLNHPKVQDEYIQDAKKHLFIPVDLNDLVEREVYPFWTLTFKRVADAVEKSELPTDVKQETAKIFSEGIQSQDLFLTLESIRRSLIKVVDNGFLPTIFLIRFDRMKEAVTPEFFANLQGLREATQHLLSFVFTSFRSLNTLLPQVFSQSPLASFTKELYFKPAEHQDLITIFNSYQKHYHLNLSQTIESHLFEIVDGYVQYLQLALVILHEAQGKIETKDALLTILSKDERVNLQSEELWESLESFEQSTLDLIHKGKKITSQAREESKYLWETGFVTSNDKIFSPLFDYYLNHRVDKAKAENGGVEMSKKENLLFTYLKDHIDNICEREAITEAVWPETESLGVSDWAIDRLVARVRNKLKQQDSPYEIITIKTRGYKLISNKAQ